MSDQDDPLDGEVSVEVRIEKSGLKIATKSRAFAAFDRLCGDLIDIPDAYIEGIPRRKRAKDAAREDRIRIENEAAKEKLLADTSAGDRVLDLFLAELTRKQSNKDAVAREAHAELASVPPTEEEEQDPASIEDDWLNVFSAHAENASSDHLRKLWGRILAGEIRKPKSFTLATLRFVAELDQEIAESFQRIVKTRLINGILPRHPSISGGALFELLFLQEVGLFQPIQRALGWPLEPDASGFVLVPNGARALRIKPLANQALRLPIVNLSRVGMEIASILPVEDEDVSLRAIAKILEEYAESLELCTFTKKPLENELEYRVDESIK